MIKNCANLLSVKYKTGYTLSTSISDFNNGRFMSQKKEINHEHSN